MVDNKWIGFCQAKIILPLTENSQNHLLKLHAAVESNVTKEI